MAKKSGSSKKRVVKVEPLGQAHIHSSFNNIIISLTNNSDRSFAGLNYQYSQVSEVSRFSVQNQPISNQEFPQKSSWCDCLRQQGKLLHDVHEMSARERREKREKREKIDLRKGFRRIQFKLCENFGE